MKQRRIKLGFTQEYLEDILNIPKGFVSQFESGKLTHRKDIYKKLNNYYKLFEKQPETDDIKELRKHLGITQEEVGAFFKVKKSYISQIESGKLQSKHSKVLRKRILIYLKSHLIAP